MIYAEKLMPPLVQWWKGEHPVTCYKTMVVYVRPADGIVVVRHRSVHASSPERAVAFVRDQIERQYGTEIKFASYGSKAEPW